MRPWYHNFEKLGVQTNFPDERSWKNLWFKKQGIRHHAKQQERKEKCIVPFIKKSISDLHNGGNLNPRILYLFASDGYYGFLAKKMSPNSELVLVDNDFFAKEHISDMERAKTMAHVLNIADKTYCVKEDVNNYIKNSSKFDLILCLGGLYHIENPKEFLQKLKSLTSSYLVISSAVKADTSDPNYFETPRPGFTWGSWFSEATLHKWLLELNYNIVDSCSDKREGDDTQAIGGAYYLCKQNS